MHELSIASSILEHVLEFAQTARIKKVLSVRLALGELMGVETEQLRFCYRILTQETPMEDSQLEIEAAAAVVHCPSCGYSGAPRYWEGALAGALIPTLQCPGCGKTVEAIEGHECSIRTIRYVAQ